MPCSTGLFRLGWMFGLALVFACGLGSGGEAAAQFGIGIGYGGGFGIGFGFGFQPSPSTTYLNERALVGQRMAQSNNPTPLRAPQPSGPRGFDPTFFQTYDVSSRRAMEDLVARRPSRRLPPVAATTPPTTPATPVPAPAAVRVAATLASFFNQYEELVWPADAPRDDDLMPKRETSDAASLAVLREQKSQGQASLGLVTDARQKLLSYGRPALARMRERTTTQLSDAFHQFLLSLYDSLQAAASPPKS